MEGVYRRGSSPRDACCNSPECPRLGCMCVNDVGSELPNVTHQSGKRAGIVSWAEGPAEPSYSGRFHIERLGEQVVGFVLGAPSCEETLIKLIAGEVSHEARDLDGWAADVHPRDHAHDPELAHGLSLPVGDRTRSAPTVTVGPRQ